MTDIDPRNLKPGDWFVWHELKPQPYRVLERVGDGYVLIAEHGGNVKDHGVGNFTPAAVSIRDRRFERVPPPDWAREDVERAAVERFRAQLTAAIRDAEPQTCGLRPEESGILIALADIVADFEPKV